MDRAHGKPTIIVSACLLGLRTRYDGSHCVRQKLLGMADRTHIVPICPEQLGGLPTPRTPAEIQSGSGHDVLDGRSAVLTGDGRDVTAHYVRGARMAAAIAKLVGAEHAVLKEGSPSCGYRRLTRDDRNVSGPGVAAALLDREGVHIDGFE